MLSEQLMPEVHGDPTEGGGGTGGGGGAGGMDEHVPTWQLPPMQSVSVKQDCAGGGNGSSEEDVEEDDCVAATQLASNPRSNTVARLMS